MGKARFQRFYSIMVVVALVLAVVSVWVFLIYQGVIYW